MYYLKCSDTSAGVSSVLTDTAGPKEGAGWVFWFHSPTWKKKKVEMQFRQRKPLSLNLQNDSNAKDFAEIQI